MAVLRVILHVLYLIFMTLESLKLLIEFVFYVFYNKKLEMLHNSLDNVLHTKRAQAEITFLYSFVIVSLLCMYKFYSYSQFNHRTICSEHSVIVSQTIEENNATL